MNPRPIVVLLALFLTSHLLFAALPTPFERTVRDGVRYGYKDVNGTVVIPAVYRLAQNFSEEEIAAVVDEKGWAMIDKTGKVLLRPFVYDNGPDYFVEGLARFRENGCIGFFNTRGQKVIPAEFDFAYPFENGVARVASGCREVRGPDEHTTVEGGVWSTIDITGRRLAPWR